MAHDDDQVALLVVRVWLEPGAAPPAMRARLTATSNLTDRDVPPEVRVAADVDAVCDHVRRWLGDFLATAHPAS